MPQASEEVRFCPVEGCGKKLRRHNKRGKCSGCMAGRKPGTARSSKRATQPPADGSSVERMRTVAGALGYDADELMAGFAEAWLADLRERFEESAS